MKNLVVKWNFSIPLWRQLLPDTPYYAMNMRYFGLETTPLVADGIMYVTGPQQVSALDALTGRRDLDVFTPAHCGTGERSVARHKSWCGAPR